MIVLVCEDKSVLLKQWVQVSLTFPGQLVFVESRCVHTRFFVHASLTCSD